MLMLESRSVARIAVFAGIGIGLIGGFSAWLVTVDVVPVVVSEVLKAVLPLVG